MMKLDLIIVNNIWSGLVNNIENKEINDIFESEFNSVLKLKKYLFMFGKNSFGQLGNMEKVGTFTSFLLKFN